MTPEQAQLLKDEAEQWGIRHDLEHSRAASEILTMFEDACSLYPSIFATPPDAVRQAKYGEPWHLVEDAHEDDQNSILDANDVLVTDIADSRFFPCLDDDSRDAVDDEAYARRDRIIACVNALAGIDDPQAFVAQALALTPPAEGGAK